MGLSGMTLCDLIVTPQNGALHRGTLRQCALNHDILGNGLPGMAFSLVGLRESERGGWSIGDGPSERIRPRWCTRERHSETVDPGETRQTLRKGRFGRDALGNGFPGMACSLVGLRPEHGGWCIGGGPSESIHPRNQCRFCLHRHWHHRNCRHQQRHHRHCHHRHHHESRAKIGIGRSSGASEIDSKSVPEAFRIAWRRPKVFRERLRSVSGRPRRVSGGPGDAPKTHRSAKKSSQERTGAR